MRELFCAIALVLSLAGCSWMPTWVPTWVPNVGVYKLDVNQGNYVTQDQVEHLKVGLTRAQVRGILGTPILTDAFHANRWDYPYEFNRLGRTLEHRQFTVYFVDDKVARWEGDEMPPSPAEVARSGGGDAALDKSLSTAPKTGEENWLQALLRKMGWWQ